MPHLLPIREVVGSGLGPQTEHPEVYGFRLFHQTSAWIAPYIMPDHLLPQYFSSLFINPFFGAK